MKRKLVYINPQVDSDIEKYMANKKFSTYVKELIRRDMRSDAFLNGNFIGSTSISEPIVIDPLKAKMKPNKAAMKNLKK
jgi:hypothetical protein